MSKILFTSHTANFNKFNQPFMKWFKDAGHTVHYASIGEEVIENCDVQYKISFHRSPYSVDNIKAYRPLKKIIDNGEYDIIHTHTPMGSVVTRLASRNARKRYGTKIIYTAHGFHFFKGSTLKSWALFYSVEKLLARYTDVLVTINLEDFQRASRKFNTSVVYVPGVGIDKDKFDKKYTVEQKTKLKKTLGLNPTDFVILYSAEISQRKRQQWLIQSMSDFIKADRSVHLLLVGSDSLKGDCHELVRKLQLDKNVHFLGYRNDIPDLLSISDMAVSASNQEGLPVSIMEAMYSKRPIVATDCRGNRDLIRNLTNGFLIDQNDSQKLLENIRLIMTKDMRVDKYVSQAKKDIKKHLLESILPQMVNVYVGDINGAVISPQPEYSLPANPARTAVFFNRIPNYSRNINRISRRRK